MRMDELSKPVNIMNISLKWWWRWWPAWRIGSGGHLNDVVENDRSRFQKGRPVPTPNCLEPTTSKLRVAGSGPPEFEMRKMHDTQLHMQQHQVCHRLQLNVRWMVVSGHTRTNEQDRMGHMYDRDIYVVLFPIHFWNKQLWKPPTVRGPRSLHRI